MDGRDRIPSGYWPLTVKVRNTFIEANGLAEDAAELADAGLAGHAATPHRRQVSEPDMRMQRQSVLRVSAGPAREEELEEPEWECQEPETEKEPSWFHQQDGKPAREQLEDMNFGSSSHFCRQVTEMNWPSWRAPDAQQFPRHPGIQVEDRLQFRSTVPLAGQRPPPPEEREAQEQLPAVFAFQPIDVPSELAGLPLDGCTMPAQMQSSGGWQNPMASTAVEASASSNPGLASAAMAGMREVGDASGLGSNGAGGPLPEWSSVYTVMMRNLPNKHTQTMLLEELNKSGFQGTFDFLYLPIDPETNANRGYAFINFIDSGSAWMLRMMYEGRKMSGSNSEKVVSVSPATLQGFEANYAHYSKARIRRGGPAARPLFLREPSLQHALPKIGAGCHGGGRHSTGSVIDVAAGQQQESRTAMDMASMQQHRQAMGLAPSGPTGQAGEFHVGLHGKNSGPKKPAALGGSMSTGGSPQVPKFCANCGGKCEPEYRFCKFCGDSLIFSGGTAV